MPQACHDGGGVEAIGAVGVARGHDEDDPLAELLVLDAERDGVAD